MRKYAFIVVDLQNDFAYPGGAIYVPGTEKLILKITKIIELLKNCKNWIIVLTQDTHLPNDPTFKRYDIPPHGIKGTFGHKLVFSNDILKYKNVFVIQKTTNSAFKDTNLMELLVQYNVDTVFISGLFGEYCVFHTARDSALNGFDTFIVTDLVGFIDEKLKNEIIEKFRKLKIKITSYKSFLDFVNKTCIKINGGNREMRNLNNRIKKVLSLVKESTGVTSTTDQDISQAKNLTVNSTEKDFIKAVGLDPKTFFRIYRTLHEILYNKDGSLTKFARQHQITDFNKFYTFLRDKVKPLIKNDHLVEAFELIREMYMVAYPKVLAKGLVDDPVYAVNFVARTIYYVLDNLRILQKVFKIMNYMEQSSEFKSTMLALEKKFGA